MAEVTNSSRAGWAMVGLQAFRNRTCAGTVDRDLSNESSFEEGLSDLLADLMHLADEYGEDVFARCLSRGAYHYTEEVREAAAEGRTG